MKTKTQDNVIDRSDRDTSDDEVWSIINHVDIPDLMRVSGLQLVAQAESEQCGY